MVGSVPVGDGAPVSIQSMLNTRTTDVEACLAQIRALAAAGCEIARLAVPDMEAAETFGAICAASPLPLVADIHFDYRLAIRAAENGVRVTGLSAYYHTAPVNPQTAFVISYSEIPDACITEAVNRLAKAVTAAVKGER